MAKSKMAPRQAAKKPRQRNPLKKATAKRAMPLRTRDPVRTGQIKSHGKKVTKRKRVETDKGVASSANNDVTPSSGLFTMLVRWSPLGLFLRQQALLADACLPHISIPGSKLESGHVQPAVGLAEAERRAD